MPKFNRRQFLGSTAAAAAFAAAPAIVQAAVVEKKVDLVIVGGGLAGLAAANAAVKKGVKPIVLEKEAFLGGAGLFPEGSLGVGTRYQKEHGIKTTVQQVLDAALQFHHYRCDPAVLRVLIEESRQTIDEIQDMGIEFRGIRTMYDKHESLMTWHLFVGGAAKVIELFVKSIRQGGGELRTQTSAQRLIMNNGKVTGVEARDAKGNTIILHAKKVIIATGGFAANKEMLAQNVTDSSALGMVEPIWLRGPVVDGRTGDGITMARLVGANVAGMHAVAGNAPYLPDVPPINQFSGPDELKQGRCALAQPWLWVNHEGKRFFNESRGAVFVDVYNAMTSAGGVLYTIFDQSMIDDLINKGAVLPFNAIVLAGVPPENLESSMKRVNEFAKTGVDEEFSRKPEHLRAFNLNKGPYYALKGVRCFFLTLGGVTVTPQFEAKNPQGNVIPNLYVVGQDIGGLYDSSYDLRCEGSASSFAMTSGRVAAENAIKAIEAGRV